MNKQQEKLVKLISMQAADLLECYQWDHETVNEQQAIIHANHLKQTLEQYLKLMTNQPDNTNRDAQ
jgi:hypothetical protein